MNVSKHLVDFRWLFVKLQFVAVLVAESRSCGQHTTKDPLSGLVGVVILAK